jgi:hypothetical protein
MSAYVFEIKSLPQRLLDEPLEPDGSPNTERGHVFRRALRELDAPSATWID